MAKPEGRRAASRRNFLRRSLGAAAGAVLGPAAIVSANVRSASAGDAPAAFDVRAHGAQSDGATLATAAIQKAIDACSAAGGGAVRFPPGTYLTGTLHLKSRVTLSLDQGATILGSTDLKDYPESVASVRSYTDKYVNRSLIAGDNLDRVAITGGGTIDGNGAAFRRKEYLTRPYVIRLVGCRDVLVEGVTLRNSPMWMQHYLACDRLTVRGITVNNHVSYNNDGLDIDGCREVRVAGCLLDSDDDALCLKSTLDRPCEDVVIADCRLASHCNAMKMGTESNGGFVNIEISKLTIASPTASKPMYGAQRGMGGLALEIVDGGRLDDVHISDVTITGVTAPIFLRLGNRARPIAAGAPKPGIGTFRNVTISSVKATGASAIGCAFAGLPGHPIENVTLTDVSMTFEGGGKKVDPARVPEKPDAYPESAMFGPLPAFGIYGRHLRGLTLRNVRLETASADERPPTVFDDVEGLTVADLPVRTTSHNDSLFWEWG